MVAENTIYAVNISEGVSYVKGNGSLYLTSKMGNYKALEPYLQTKRGVYLLIGKGKAYIGEGNIFNRLMKHARTKLWVEEVYIFIRDEEMTKEDSLQYEGELTRYIQNHTNYSIDNKARVRDNLIDIGEAVQAFKWLGLTVQEPKKYIVHNIKGETVLQVHRTIYNTLKVVTVYKDTLQWLTGLEFTSIGDITSIVNTLGLEENTYG